MKKVLILLSALLLVTMIKAQTSGGSIPQAAIQDFTSRYPSITPKKWKKDKQGEYVARFHLGHNSSEAFYDKNGAWVQTQTYFKWTRNLPPPVRKALAYGDYASCYFDHMQETDSAGQKRFYVNASFLNMHTEGPGDSYRLTISPEGRLLRSEEID